MRRQRNGTKKRTGFLHLPPRTSMRMYQLSSRDVRVHLWPKNHSLSVSPDSVFCLCFKRQTRSSEPIAGDSVDLGPVWQHVHSHLSPGHHPSLCCPLLRIHPPPSEGCSVCAAVSKQHLQIQMEHPRVLLIVHEAVRRTSRWALPPVAVH